MSQLTDNVSTTNNRSELCKSFLLQFTKLLEDGLKEMLHQMERKQNNEIRELELKLLLSELEIMELQKAVASMRKRKHRHN